MNLLQSSLSVKRPSWLGEEGGAACSDRIFLVFALYLWSQRSGSHPAVQKRRLWYFLGNFKEQNQSEVRWLEINPKFFTWNFSHDFGFQCSRIWKVIGKYSSAGRHISFTHANHAASLWIILWRMAYAQKSKSHLKYWGCSEEFTGLNFTSENPNRNPAVASESFICKWKVEFDFRSSYNPYKTKSWFLFPWNQNANLPLTVLLQNYAEGSGSHVAVSHFGRIINI